MAEEDQWKSEKENPGHLQQTVSLLVPSAYFPASRQRTLGEFPRIPRPEFPPRRRLQHWDESESETRAPPVQPDMISNITNVTFIW